MTNQDFDVFNMKDEIDFELEELMLIEPILPKSPSPILHDTTDVANYQTRHPIFTYTGYTTPSFIHQQRLSIVNPKLIDKINLADNAKIPDSLTSDLNSDLMIVDKLSKNTQTQHQLQQNDEYDRIFISENQLEPDSTSNTLSDVPHPEIIISPQNFSKSQPAISHQSHHTSVYFDNQNRIKPIRKIQNAIFTAGLFSLVGLVVDCVLHIVRALTTESIDKVAWLFFPSLAIIGLFFGYFFGAKALNTLFASSNTLHLDEEADSDFISSLLRAGGIGIGIAIIGWLAMLIML